MAGAHPSPASCADVTHSSPSHTTTTMPLSLPLLMPTVLAKASEHTRSDLQQRWNSCASAQEYLDVVRSARVSTSHHNMLCGTSAYIDRLNLNEKIDRL